GAEVTGLALPPEAPSLYADLGLSQRMASTFADIRDRAAATMVMHEAKPQIVFHLAAQAIVRAAYADPVAAFATNVMGTAHVLEAARNAPSVRAVVCVTSDKCYDNREQAQAFREGDALGGRDPYSASKAAAEIVAGSWRETLFPLEGRVRVATARAGNVIGGGDWAADRLIPDIVRAIEAGRPLVLRNPDAVRPWQHVLEPLRGYLALGEGLLAGAPVEGAWNFGPGRASEIGVADMARRFAAAAGAALDIEIEPSPLPEAQVLRLDIGKAAAGLGWRPILSIDDAVALTAQWWQARATNPAGIAGVTRAQIEGYREAVSEGAAGGRKTKRLSTK
ncbi:MAG TPA: CDP-glucose 4,6-dehydratase, partial [Caulobacteraceae bacterium]